VRTDAPGSGGSSSVGSAGTSGNSGFSSSLRSGIVDPNGNAVRARGDQPTTGTASPRPIRGGGGGGIGGGDNVSFPFYGPWGNWYPWYYGGFGWGAGYYGYSPWYYGATCWSWGRYGPWYDPYGYCWDPLWTVGVYAGSSENSGERAGKPAETMGSIRLKASPETAKVYVDGALAGTVDEFNGLNDHLEIEGGRRSIKLVAEGYQDYVTEIVVKVGKTLTVRASMKKK
jgi:hypothetical protein